MKFVRERVEGKILNLFAGKNIVKKGEIRVDVDSTMPDLTYNMGAEAFLVQAIHLDKSFQTIIYDSPWNKRKAKEFYNGNYVGVFTKLKNNIVSILEPGGKIISAGYEITNFGISRGMELEELLIVNPMGEIRPFFISIERKLPSLNQFWD